MLNHETPNEWKRHSTLYPVVSVTDDYGCQTLKKVEGIDLYLCWQPITDEALLKEYGFSHTGSIQAVLYDFDTHVKPFDIVEYEGEEYEVKGIKRFLSYRLIIAERVDKREQKQL